MKKDRFCLSCRVAWDKVQLGRSCPCCNVPQFFTCNARDIDARKLLDSIDLTLFDLKEVTVNELGQQIIKDSCACGQKINVELNCKPRCSRKDNKRPHYPDEELPAGLDPNKYSRHSMSAFRCRKCSQPVNETVPSAKYNLILTNH